MTVSTENARVQHDGNGATTVFPVPFPFLATTDLAVYLTSGGVDTLQTIAAHYTVTGGDPTGSLTMLTAPANGETLTIVRDMPYTQPTEYPNQGGYQSAVLEGSLDRLTMLAGQLREALNRSLTLPPASPLIGLELPAPVANHYLKWDATGTDLISALLATTALTVSSFMESVLTAANAAAARVAIGENASGSPFTRKHNFAGTAPPTVNDDAGDGYAIGSEWFDTTNDRLYELLNSTAASAVWRLKTPSAADHNMILNGSVTIDQINSGTAVTVDADVGPDPASLYFLGPDGWMAQGEIAQGVFTIQRIGLGVSADPDFQYTHALRVTITTADAALAAGDAYNLQLPIEGYEGARAAMGNANAKPVTLTFWAHSTVSGTFSGCIHGETLDSPNYVFTYTINATSTWEKKTIVIPGHTGATGWSGVNTLWGRVFFDLGSGSNHRGTANVWAEGDLSLNQGATGAVSLITTLGAVFHITGVRMHVGAYLADAEIPTLHEELFRAARYYQKTYPAGSNAGAITGVGALFQRDPAGVGAQPALAWRLPVPMRATPTIQFYSHATGAVNTVRDNTSASDRAVSSVSSTGDRSSGYPTLSTSPAANTIMSAHIVAKSFLV